MATDGNGNYVVRVLNSATWLTAPMTPLDARYAVTNYPARYSTADAYVQPVGPLMNPVIWPNGVKVAVTGSKGANAALTSLMTTLASYVLTDSTS